MMGSRLVVLFLLVLLLGGCASWRADESVWDSEAGITRYFTDGVQASDADIQKINRRIEQDWRDSQTRLAERQQAMIKQSDANAKLWRSAKQDDGRDVFEQLGTDASATEPSPPGP